MERGLFFDYSMKTNATRILDKLGIAYETRSYPVDPDDLGAEKVAQGIGLPIERVFKTLVARGDKNGIFWPLCRATSKWI